MKHAREGEYDARGPPAYQRSAAQEGDEPAVQTRGVAVLGHSMTSRKQSITRLWRPLSSARAHTPVPANDNPALQAIWHVVCAIPRGQAATYGTVARAAGLPGRARQAGFALRVAPAELNLPWHRVVGAGGRIAFPVSTRQHKEQARRLRAEGVPVKNGRVAASALSDLGEL